MTFKQALEYGGSVRKGEKSTAILWCEPRSKKTTADDGTEGEDRFWISKVYRVFNAEQCDGLPDKYTDKPAHTLDAAQRIEHADAFIRNTGANIRHGSGGAFYRPSEDLVNLPPFEAFTSPEGYYGTALHELGHWTGHTARLARDLKPSSDRQSYAREEIIAELAAVFTCASLGITPPDLEEHAAHIQFWIEAMKADPRYLFSAASKAQAAADYLTNLQPKV
jgi:antirestriction protein ArdC